MTSIELEPLGRFRIRIQEHLRMEGAAFASVVTAPTFETNDDRYRWLNQVQAIAKGRRDGLDLIYELYAVR